jgi:hypothetical protein
MTTINLTEGETLEILTDGRKFVVTKETDDGAVAGIQIRTPGEQLEVWPRAFDTIELY